MRFHTYMPTHLGSQLQIAQTKACNRECKPKRTTVQTFVRTWTGIALNVNRFEQCMCGLERYSFGKTAAHAHNSKIKRNKKRRTLFGNQTVVLLSTIFGKRTVVHLNPSFFYFVFPFLVNKVLIHLELTQPYSIIIYHEPRIRNPKKLSSRRNNLQRRRFFNRLR